MNFDKAVCQFDFPRVRSVMRLLEWTWGDSSEIPTVQEMEDTVDELFEHIKDDLKEREESYCATGGFKVTANKDCSVDIEFIAEEASGG